MRRISVVGVTWSGKSLFFDRLAGLLGVRHLTFLADAARRQAYPRSP
jgi:hypothetical protein